MGARSAAWPTGHHGCPRCGGRRIVRGRLGGGERSSARFRPSRIRLFRWLAWVGPWIAVARPSELCIDCGLIWSSVDPGEAVRKIRLWGKEELKRGLGLVEQKCRPSSEDLA